MILNGIFDGMEYLKGVLAKFKSFVIESSNKFLAETRFKLSAKRKRERERVCVSILTSKKTLSRSLLNIKKGRGPFEFMQN